MELPSNTPVQQTQIQNDPAKGLGIAGLVLAFFAPLIGLILSIVAYSKSKQAGFKNTPALIGIILSAVFMVLGFLVILLVFLSVPALQKNSRNTAAKNNVAIIQTSLEEFRANNMYYPATLNDLTTLDSSMLDTPSGYEYTYTPTPAGCTRCQGYTVSTTLEGGQVYVSESY